MSVMVSSRLGDVLRNQGLTAHDLQRRIATRFGLVVDARTLDRLAQADQVRRPNLQIAAAAADILGVGLDDLFVLKTTTMDADGSETKQMLDEKEDYLDSVPSRRLEDLFEAQDWRELTDDECVELRSLTAEWGRRANEQALRKLASVRGQSIEQVRADVAADLDRATAWWTDVQADPERLETLIAEAHAKQQARIGG